MHLKPEPNTVLVNDSVYQLIQTAANLNAEIPSLMFDFIKVLIVGAGKYTPNNWLNIDGGSSDHKSMHASMFRHLAESSSGSTKDKDTGLDPLLHLACRALMFYTRRQRGIIHPIDGFVS